VELKPPLILQTLLFFVVSFAFALHKPPHYCTVLYYMLIDSINDCSNFPRDSMAEPRIVIPLPFVEFTRVGNTPIEIGNENVVNTKRFGSNVFRQVSDNIPFGIPNLSIY
jgi:hypothetical protein